MNCLTCYCCFGKRFFFFFIILKFFPFMSPNTPPTQWNINFICINPFLSSNDHPCQAWFYLVEQFCRRRLKCERRHKKKSNSQMQRSWQKTDIPSQSSYNRFSAIFPVKPSIISYSIISNVWRWLFPGQMYFSCHGIVSH